MRTDPTVPRLTPREREIALLVAGGLPDVVIAHRLGLKPGTVSTYVQRIKARLRLTRRADIAAWVAARPVSDGPDSPPRRERATTA